MRRRLIGRPLTACLTVGLLGAWTQPRVGADQVDLGPPADRASIAGLLSCRVPEGWYTVTLKDDALRSAIVIQVFENVTGGQAVRQRPSPTGVRIQPTGGGEAIAARQVVSAPHPTGARGLPDVLVASFDQGSFPREFDVVITSTGTFRDMRCHFGGSATDRTDGVFVGRILVDASRDGGVWWYPQTGPFDPRGSHQGMRLAARLRRTRQAVDELPRGATITRTMLSNYGAVIRAAGAAPYSTDEIDAYRDYVSRGGRLLLMAAFIRPGEPDELAESFGLHVAGYTAGAQRVDRFASHPITRQVAPIDPYLGSGVLSAPPWFTPLAFASARTYLDVNFNDRQDPGEPAGLPVWGVMRFGRGTVVFISDLHGLEQVQQPLTDNVIAFLLESAG